MKYTVHAHPTTYAGVRFRSRLEARWAAFFDLCGWTWEYEPIELAGWAPDFLVSIPDHAQLYAEVKPYLELEDFASHTAWSLMDGDYTIRPAVLGNSPVTTHWTVKGNGHTIVSLIPAWDRLWKEAGNRTQWRAA